MKIAQDQLPKSYSIYSTIVECSLSMLGDCTLRPLLNLMQAYVDETDNMDELAKASRCYN